MLASFSLVELSTALQQVREKCVAVVILKHSSGRFKKLQMSHELFSRLLVLKMLVATPFSAKFSNCLRSSGRLLATLPQNLRKTRSNKDSRTKQRPVIEKHVLKKLFPWKTRDELAAHLASNVIYNKGSWSFKIILPILI